MVTRTNPEYVKDNSEKNEHCTLLLILPYITDLSHQFPVDLSLEKELDRIVTVVTIYMSSLICGVIGDRFNGCFWDHWTNWQNRRLE